MGAGGAAHDLEGAPGIRFSRLRLGSSQRRSLLPPKNQLEPLSATIIP